MAEQRPFSGDFLAAARAASKAAGAGGAGARAAIRASARYERGGGAAAAEDMRSSGIRVLQRRSSNNGKREHGDYLEAEDLRGSGTRLAQRRGGSNAKRERGDYREEEDARGGVRTSSRGAAPEQTSDRSGAGAAGEREDAPRGGRIRASSRGAAPQQSYERSGAGAAAEAAGAERGRRSSDLHEFIDAARRRSVRETAHQDGGGAQGRGQSPQYEWSGVTVNPRGGLPRATGPGSAAGDLRGLVQDGRSGGGSGKSRSRRAPSAKFGGNLVDPVHPASIEDRRSSSSGPSKSRRAPKAKFGGNLVDAAHAASIEDAGRRRRGERRSGTTKPPEDHYDEGGLLVGLPGWEVRDDRVSMRVPSWEASRFVQEVEKESSRGRGDRYNGDIPIGSPMGDHLDSGLIPGIPGWDGRDDHVSMRVGSYEGTRFGHDGDVMGLRGHEESRSRGYSDDLDMHSQASGGGDPFAENDEQESMSQITASLEAMIADEDDDQSSAMTSQASTFDSTLSSAAAYFPMRSDSRHWQGSRSGEDDSYLNGGEVFGSSVGSGPQYFEHPVRGPISPWHELPLHTGTGAGSFEDVWMVTEIPKRSAQMQGIAKAGRRRSFAQPIPWNYGFLPQTFGDHSALHPELPARGSSGPLDVVDIGSRQHKSGEVVRVTVLGALAVVDRHGDLSWKIIAVDSGDELFWRLKGEEDLEREVPQVVGALRDWFRRHEIPGGLADIAYDGRAATRAWALEVIEASHTAWRRRFGRGEATAAAPSGRSAVISSWASPPPAPSPLLSSVPPPGFVYGGGDDDIWASEDFSAAWRAHSSSRPKRQHDDSDFGAPLPRGHGSRDDPWRSVADFPGASLVGDLPPL